MTDKVRLIIPLWGSVYAEKLVSMTLPALLAPGNLPSLATMFEVEVVLVTEHKLVDYIRRARSFERLSKICQVKFASLDDLMPCEPGEYGVVLTAALFRGFVDLGAKVTETFLLFLNADFIIADGSYRRLGELMREGKRVIHAPSFRVVLEEVWPQLEARVDAESAVLAVKPREMARLALTHKHLTVKARTVNQRLYHQWCMDQFYWYVDEETLIGYQWPIALVAIKPERAVTEPVLVWDFGYLPEAAPTLEPYVLTDSDEFFMIEPQKGVTGEELVRPGGISIDDIAKFLSDWTTHEQRRCGRELLTIHAGELPADLDGVIAESRRYMNEIARRLSPEPQPHVAHPKLGSWFKETSRRLRERSAAGGNVPALTAPSSQNERLGLSQALRRIHTALFGPLPFVRSAHPLWLDTFDVAAQLTSWRRSGQRILWLCSRDSLFSSVLKDRRDPASLLVARPADEQTGGDLFDACLCELGPSELTRLPALHRRIRMLVRDGGKVFVHINNPYAIPVGMGQFAAYDAVFPDVDKSTIRFHGTWLTAQIRNLYLRAATWFPAGSLARNMFAGLALITLAPIAWLANKAAARRDASAFAPHWTSVVLELEVVRKHALPLSCTARGASGRVNGMRDKI
ncbi:MAG: hypothetical protein E6G76_01540 [Alphaproteobacteria bacterium]|nr:MAG: hypothetical protein E6G76_01540 [Alphaproteobacteria bacterium]